MSEDKKEVVVVDEKQVAVQRILSPAEVAVSLLDKGVKPEDLEKMLILQERYDANQAKKSYDLAMSRVHGKIAPVVATHKNIQTGSVYADLKDIIVAVQPAYSSEGFSVSFDDGENAPEGHIRILAYVTHSLGHKETYKYDMPLDGKGLRGNANMTLIHGKASSMSYGRRYLQCMIFNIPTGDDDDGNAAGSAVEYINDEQLNVIRNFVDNNAGFEARLFKYLKIESIDKMPKKDYQKAVEVMKANKETK